jgi:hypothetical protein
LATAITFVTLDLLDSLAHGTYLAAEAQKSAMFPSASASGTFHTTCTGTLQTIHVSHSAFFSMKEKLLLLAIAMWYEKRRTMSRWNNALFSAYGLVGFTANGINDQFPTHFGFCLHCSFHP